MEKIKWCVIGAGGIADRRTIPALIQDETNELVAIMEANAEIAKRVGDKYGVPYYLDEEEMFKNEECDAVYISTPVFCHYRQAMLALKYGKHVFLEKPIALNSIEGKELLDTAKKAGKLLYIGYMMKFHNLHEKAKRIIKNDGVGQVSNVRMQFSCWYPDIPGAWRQNKKLGGGGAIMDLAVHCLDLADYILKDEIKDVKAFYSTRTFSYEVDDSAVILFKTKGGVIGHIDVNFNVPDVASISKLEVYGTKGYIYCNNTLSQEETGKLSHLYAPQGDYEAMQERKIIKPKNYKGKGTNLYLKQLQAFTKLLKKGKLDYSSAKRALRVQQVVDKIYAEN